MVISGSTCTANHRKVGHMYIGLGTLVLIIILILLLT